ncbi:MAG: hypothetical protein RIQ33_424 [Bacteroidota bacterium]|jgi:hypothetical protein
MNTKPNNETIQPPGQCKILKPQDIKHKKAPKIIVII